jgi:ABC-type antimicrobial peptide transport system ATPase subunit
MPYALHAIVIDKSLPIDKAKKMAQDIIKDTSKTFYRVTGDSYRFRNIPKTKFDPKTFRSKIINKDITLIFGELKS